MQFVSRGYWDPEESTREKWTNTYAAELQERGLSQDFTGLSELLLGQAQPAQFQSAGQTGYWWGSKVSDDGSFTTLDSVANNVNAEMPRAYDNDGANTYGGYYNWYAATAESGTYSMASGNAEDSLCPAGWQLPIDGDSSTSKSWQGLLFGSYGLSSNSASSLTMRQIPLSVPFTGHYSSSGALGSRGSGGNFWSSAATSTTNARSLYFYASFIGPQNKNNRVAGFSVRCVQK